MMNPNDLVERLSCPNLYSYWQFSVNPYKKLINKLLPDYMQFSVLKRYIVDGKDTCYRAGAPILTYRGHSYYDTSDNHTIVVGSSNSGKTYSFIHHMIESCRMAGTSIIVADIKGELLPAHKDLLIRDGYDIQVVDFIHPDHSACWNPFGEVITRYREVQELYKQDELGYERFINNKRKQLKCLAAAIKKNEELTDQIAKSNGKTTVKSQALIQDINNILAEAAEYSDICYEFQKKYVMEFEDTFELLHDACTWLCEEKDAKQPFFWQAARSLMEGAVAYMLEEYYLDENGNVLTLDDEQINFANVNLFVTEGFKAMKFLNQDTSLLRIYLDYFRRKTDRSHSVLDKIVSGNDKSRGDVLSVFDQKIQVGLLDERIKRLTARTTVDFKSIPKKKTAFFFVVHDDKDTYYKLLTIMMTQVYSEMVRAVRNEKNQACPIPVDVIWDEFGISPPLPKIDSIISASRFRHIRWCFVVQDYSQLESNYGSTQAQTLRANLGNTIYLLSTDEKTLKEISSRAGNGIRWDKSKGQWDKYELVSPEQLKTFSLGQALVLRGRRMPILMKYIAYDKYVYQAAIRQEKKNKQNVINPESQLKQFKIFSLADQYQFYKDMKPKRDLRIVQISEEEYQMPQDYTDGSADFLRHQQELNELVDGGEQ